MRFRANIHNCSTFAKFTASLASLGNVAWVRLSSDDVRFTIIPERGTQVWSQVAIDTIFESYTIQSASANNAINLEVPLQPLLRALRSATAQAKSASIRLTKKDGMPWLCMTIVTYGSARRPAAAPPDGSSSTAVFPDPTAQDGLSGPRAPGATEPEFGDANTNNDNGSSSRERETIVTQDIPVRVLPPESVAGLHEPRCREPDVHIFLPPLPQLKAVSDRFTRLAVSTSSSSSLSSAGFGTGPTSTNLGSSGAGGGGGGSGGGKSTRLTLAATMHGSLRLSLRTDSLRIASTWRGLLNPELNPDAVEGGEAGLAAHPSTRMREVAPAEDDDYDGDDGDGGRGWARVRIDARDWSRVLSCGRVGGRVVAWDYEVHCSLTRSGRGRVHEVVDLVSFIHACTDAGLKLYD